MIDEPPVCKFCKHSLPSYELVLGKYNSNGNQFIRESDILWALCVGCAERFEKSLIRISKRWEKELAKREERLKK